MRPSPEEVQEEQQPKRKGIKDSRLAQEKYHLKQKFVTTGIVSRSVLYRGVNSVPFGRLDDRSKFFL